MSTGKWLAIRARFGKESLEQMLHTCALIALTSQLILKKPQKHLTILDFIILIVSFCFKEVT